MSCKTIQVRPLAGALGAEVLGVDLRNGGDNSTWAELHQVFLDNHVIAVRGQDLSLDDLMALGRRGLGPSKSHFCNRISGRK